MKNNEYLKLVKNAQSEKLKIVKQLQQHIRGLYKEVADDLERKLAKANPDSLTSRWLYDYKKSLEIEIERISREIEETTKKKIGEVVQIANNPQLSFFDEVNDKYKLNLDETFSSVFSRVNTNVINEILSGKIYKDNMGLSERIWMDSKYIKNDIQNIIIKGITSKKSSYELAKDLEKYINPDARKEWDWSKVYPGSRRKIDYNAQRLARTAVQHAYQMAQVRSCKDNPFIDEIEWNSAFAHGKTCELCMERHGKTYKPMSLPLDHPNGLCYTVPVISKSFKEIGEELRDWVDGENNPGIDRWIEMEL